MRESHTAIIDRNAEWTDLVETEPYEVSWASEAIFFVRLLDANGDLPAQLAVQISPDGIRWCDEGSLLELDFKRELCFVRVSHFGGWLRLKGEIPSGQRARIITYLTIKE